MARLSFFGAPRDGFRKGGAHIAVHVIPVFDNRLVVFDVDAPGVMGRFFPWTVLEFGGNPYVDASLLVDDWCQGAVESLQLVDVIGGRQAEGSEELSIVFRAELTAVPEGDKNRMPVLLEAGELGPIRGFGVAELLRWLDATEEGDSPVAGVPQTEANPPDDDRPRLVF